MNVLAVDPGKMTGVWWFRTEDPVQSGDGTQLAHDDFLDWFAMHELDFETVVCETFTITQRSMTQRGERMWSLEQIGVMRWLCRRGAIPYVEQSPSDAKSFATDKKLRRVEWYKPGKEHCRDAARHALLWAVRNGHVSPHVLLDSVD